MSAPPWLDTHGCTLLWIPLDVGPPLVHLPPFMSSPGMFPSCFSLSSAPPQGYILWISPPSWFSSLVFFFPSSLPWQFFLVMFLPFFF